MVARSPAMSPAISPARRVTDVSGSGGAAPWNPGNLGNNLLARFLDGQSYNETALDGFQILKPQESFVTLRAPRKGRYYVADGVNDYIAIASLTGSETVVSSGGTGTPSIASGRINLTAGTYWDIVLSNGSHYPCCEEAGTTAYDISDNAAHGTITNATTPTPFHGNGATRISNRNNEFGYRLSSGVYVPKRLNSDLAADGNALTVTGQSPYPANVEVPCITGDGSTVYASFTGTAALHGSQMTFGGWVFHDNATSGFISKGVNAQWGLTRQAGIYTLRAGVGGAGNFDTNYSIVDTGTWNHVVGRIDGTTRTIYYNGVPVVTETGKEPPGSANTSLVQIGRFGTVWPLNGRVSGMGYWGRLLSDAEVLAWYNGTLPSNPDFFAPLQDGPGLSNTNRDISILTTGNVLSVASGALLNGTASTIWGNRCPVAQDWCVKYGGDIAANGAFLPGQISGSLAADGTAKTLAAGKFGNPFSRLNFNPFDAAEYNGRSIPTAYEVADDLQAAVDPEDSAFRRSADNGDDRFAITREALTGTDLTKANDYVS